MSGAQEKREISSDYENDASAISAASSLTFHMGSGTDTATDRYLDISGGFSYGLEVFPTVACCITAINGKTLKTGLSVGTGGWRAQTGRFNSVTITAGSATVVEIFAKS